MAGAVHTRKNFAGRDADIKLIETLKNKMKQDRKNAHIPASVDEFCRIYGRRDKSIAMLSADQRIAVGSITGQNLLFAVPGSGKTAVIVARAGYMLHGNHGLDIRPENMVTLTFSRKAAQEMAERYKKIFPEDSRYCPCFKTIHSFCLNEILRPLRRSGYDFPQNIMSTYLKYTDEETGRIKSITITRLMDEVIAFLKDQAEKNQVRAFLPKYMKLDDYKTLSSAITYMKNKMLPGTFCKKQKVYIDDTFYVNAADLIEAYDYILHDKYKGCDFDDILAYAYDGLKQNPELLKVIRSKYTYWSIDEAQDNSPLQTALIKQLSKTPNNLFMVGDDDQSIYGFRGAEQMGLLEFGAEPESHIMTMGINYRSDSQIVNIARTFVEKVKIRADKEMKASSSAPGIVTMKPFNDEKKMYDYILDRAVQVNKMRTIHSISGGNPQTSLAVLYRTNYPAISLAFLLYKHGISFNLGSGIRECLANPKLVRILSFIDFVINEKSYYTFMRLHSRVGLPRCYKQDSEKLMRLSELHKNIPVYQLYLKHICNISLNGSQEMPVVDKIKELTEIYGRHIEENKSLIMAQCIMRKNKAKQKKKDEESPIDSRISGVLELFSSPEDFVKAYHAICDFEEQNKERCPVVDILTMHGSKGLQYDEVILTECVEKIDSHAKPDGLNVNSSNDGRRLFYVGMTRAKKRLSMLYTRDDSVPLDKVINYFNEVAEICSKLGYNEEKDVPHPLKVGDEKRITGGELISPSSLKRNVECFSCGKT